MDAIRNPIGDLPPEVYWRRRIVVLAFLVLAFLVLYYLVRGAFSGEEPDTSPSPSPSPSVSPSPGTAIQGQPTCGVGDLLINLSPTTRNFASPSSATFQAAITHTGLADCVLDPREVRAGMMITSGSDRIWSNLDCGDALFSDAPTLLSPNATVTLSATWPRIRSNESCQVGLPSPRPGTYHALLTLHGVESTDAVFTLSD